MDTLHILFELGSTAYQIHCISPFLKSKSTSDAKIPFIIHLAKEYAWWGHLWKFKPICNILLQFFHHFFIIIFLIFFYQHEKIIWIKVFRKYFLTEFHSWWATKARLEGKIESQINSVFHGIRFTSLYKLAPGCKPIRCKTKPIAIWRSRAPSSRPYGVFLPVLITAVTLFFIMYLLAT